MLTAGEIAREILDRKVPIYDQKFFAFEAKDFCEVTNKMNEFLQTTNLEIDRMRARYLTRGDIAVAILECLVEIDRVPESELREWMDYNDDLPDGPPLHMDYR